MAGAVLLILLGMLPPQALAAAERGTDVYLLLIGMMLLAELARREGLFDDLAARAAHLARGSASRLIQRHRSLATILWLTALRRGGQHLNAWRFLRLGAVVTQPVLLLALAALLFSP